MSNSGQLVTNACRRNWTPVGFRIPLLLALVVYLAQHPLGAAEFNLDDLPHYRAEPQVAGMIRNFGFPLAGAMRAWEDEFQKYQPRVRFADRFPSGDVAIAGLVSGVSDLGPQGRELTLIEHLMFYETFGHAPSAVTVATGAYDTEGMANGLVVFVNARNPIASLTVDQLEGIFGAERTGTLLGFKWQLHNARGEAMNLRTWGQLGLTGDWARQEIHAYGHAPSGTTNYFQLRVLHGSDKWNPNYREYVESGSKMIGDDDVAMLGGLHHMLADELSQDPYGIAWSVLPQARGVSGIKALALASDAQGPFVLPSEQSFQDRSYPLSRSIYIYFDRKPGTPLDPKLREFLRFVLSQEGQRVIAKLGKYLPLTREVVTAQLKLLE
ncbi:MAG TPA: substrate-binding domain-containing protein [Steroidobacteraceae bacterium]